MDEEGGDVPHLGDADDPVCQVDEAVVDQSVTEGAGRPLHDVQLGLLVGEGDGGHHVGEEVHGQDGQGREGQGDAEDHPELGRKRWLGVYGGGVTRKGRISGMLLVSVYTMDFLRLSWMGQLRDVETAVMTTHKDQPALLHPHHYGGEVVIQQDLWW